MSAVVHHILHLLCAALLPPLLVGVVNRTKALFAGRQGQPFLQPYYDIAKLMQKQVVLSPTTTGVFLCGPVVAAVTALAAALIAPLAHPTAPLSFHGDFILFAYLLALGRFFTMSAALDVGSSFEGMGAAREATYACCAEPVVFFGFLALARMSGSWDMADLLTCHWTTRDLAGPATMLIVCSWMIVLLVENCRIPFDDPNTHLELTMIHEVMVLDHSGPAFGVVTYAAAVKLFVFSTLIVRLVVPLDSLSPWLQWPAFVASVLAMAVAVGVVESIVARLRLRSIPTLLLGAGVVSGFALMLLLGQSWSAN